MLLLQEVAYRSTGLRKRGVYWWLRHPRQYEQGKEARNDGSETHYSNWFARNAFPLSAFQLICDLS